MLGVNGTEMCSLSQIQCSGALHFHVIHLILYFICLPSLQPGVYDRRAMFGERFFETHVALLRDTGRMTAEDIAAHHPVLT